MLIIKLSAELAEITVVKTVIAHTEYDGFIIGHGRHHTTDAG